ncbi:MAG: hypothetical protein HUU50_12950 [Candidatus Brocadiae bacterium]|nr:hypothetical protein [Candidatus Brocadiia bacterium]
MSNSARGKVSVLLVFFVVLWVIFSALSCLLFNQIQESKEKFNKSDKGLTVAFKRLEETKAKLAKVSNLVGFHKSFSSVESMVSSVDMMVDSLNKICSDEETLLSKKSLGLRLETKEVDKARLFDIDYVRKEVVTLEDVWNACVEKIESLQKEIKQKQDSLKNAKSKYEKVRQQKNTEVEQLEASLAEKRNELEETRKNNESKIKKAEEERNLAQEIKIKEKNNLAETLRQERAQKQKHDLEKENLKERVRELQAEAAGQTGIERWFQAEGKKEKVQENPDGEILHVNDRYEIAYIDLGKPEGVLKGMSFQVFEYGKGGQKKNKGKIVVKEVQENMSKVGVVELADALNPIKKGDKIINPVYDRNKVKYFVIAGKLSQKYSLEQVRRMVKQIGGTIEDEITAKSDIVVLGEDFKKDPIYLRAVERGIETMLESEFLGYLGD